jgi:hypothetical protein
VKTPEGGAQRPEKKSKKDKDVKKKYLTYSGPFARIGQVGMKDPGLFFLYAEARSPAEG